MSQDLSPEDIGAQPASVEALTIEQAAELQDKGAQPGPEDFAILEAAPAAPSSALNQVKWPSSDLEAPDYRYVASEPDHREFTLTPNVLDALISCNRYVPYRDKGIMAFALRGAQLVQGNELEKASQVNLRQVKPDHTEFRCVIGFYYLEERRITAFTASTVPCRRAIYSYKNGGDPSNMLPSGLHTYYVWRHKAIKPALRLAYSSSDPETGAEATVLRTTNDYTLETRDRFDKSVPLDNVHCSYFTEQDDFLGASFSSWGCLTVRGTSEPSHQWKKFQNVLQSLGSRARIDLMLATGKDAAIAASNLGDLSGLEAKLAALRPGSRGPEVSRLQEKLGIQQTGFFGASTADKYTGFQRTLNGNARLADGLYTSTTDAATGWGILTQPRPTS